MLTASKKKKKDMLLSILHDIELKVAILLMKFFCLTIQQGMLLATSPLLQRKTNS